MLRSQITTFPHRLRAVRSYNNRHQGWLEKAQKDKIKTPQNKSRKRLRIVCTQLRHSRSHATRQSRRGKPLLTLVGKGEFRGATRRFGFIFICSRYAPRKILDTFLSVYKKVSRISKKGAFNKTTIKQKDSLLEVNKKKDYKQKINNKI